MILVTHAVIGASVAGYTGDPLSAFCVGLVSHYISDMIPHWHYHVPRIKEAVLKPFGKKTIAFNAHFFPEMMRVGFDLFAGILLTVIFFQNSLPIALVGGLAATIPDLLVGIGRIKPLKILVLHDKFHRWVHFGMLLDDYPFIGIGSQALIVLIFIFLFGSY